MKQLLQFAQKIHRDEIWSIAAQLSYYLLLSFFPFIIAIVSLLDYYPDGVTILMNQLERVLPEISYQLITENMQVFSGLDGGMFSIGFISTLWVATKGSKAIYRNLNREYDAVEKRHFLVVYLISFCITLSMILFILVSLLVILMSNHFILNHITSSRAVFALSQLRIWVMFLVFIVALTAMYAWVPRIKLTFRQVLPGAVVATVLWILFTVGFEIYVNNFGKYTVVYGTLGGFIVLMLWLYLISFSLLLGNEINAFLHQMRKKSG